MNLIVLAVTLDELSPEVAAYLQPGRNVGQKSGLNRSILDQGWGSFETLLAYKLAERGGTLVKVAPAYTSQTCSDCGTVDRQSRESQARVACRQCGLPAHADTHAAINIRDAGLGIRRWNTPSLHVEDGRLAAVETRTTQGTSSLGNPPASAGGRC